MAAPTRHTSPPTIEPEVDVLWGINLRTVHNPSVIDISFVPAVRVFGADGVTPVLKATGYALHAPVVPLYTIRLVLDSAKALARFGAIETEIQRLIREAGFGHYDAMVKVAEEFRAELLAAWDADPNLLLAQLCVNFGVTLDGNHPFQRVGA